MLRGRKYFAISNEQNLGRPLNSNYSLVYHFQGRPLSYVPYHRIFNKMGITCVSLLPRHICALVSHALVHKFVAIAFLALTEPQQYIHSIELDADHYAL